MPRQPPQMRPRLYPASASTSPSDVQRLRSETAQPPTSAYRNRSRRARLSSDSTPFHSLLAPLGRTRERSVANPQIFHADRARMLEVPRASRDAATAVDHQQMPALVVLGRLVQSVRCQLIRAPARRPPDTPCRGVSASRGRSRRWRSASCSTFLKNPGTPAVGASRISRWSRDETVRSSSLSTKPPFPRCGSNLRRRNCKRLRRRDALQARRVS